MSHLSATRGAVDTPSSGPDAPHLLACGSLVLDRQLRTVSCGEISACLLRQEMVVLAALMRRPGVCVRRETLISDLWPDPDLEPGDALGVVWVVVSRLRRALRLVGADERIECVSDPSGYVITGPRRYARTYTSEQAKVADAAVAAMGRD